MLASGQRQCIEHPVHAQRWQLDAFQFGIDEAQVKLGIVDDQPVITDKGQKLRRNG